MHVLVDPKTPRDRAIENEEGELATDAYREAAQKCLRIKDAGLAHIGGRLLNPRGTMKEVLLDFWTVCYAEGSYLCEGVSITDRAFQIGVEKATLSKAVGDFMWGHRLPPNEYMKNPEAMRAYREARLRSIARENSNL